MTHLSISYAPSIYQLCSLEDVTMHHLSVSYPLLSYRIVTVTKCTKCPQYFYSQLEATTIGNKSPLNYNVDAAEGETLQKKQDTQVIQIHD